jgi:hypothetical protein
MVDHTTFREDKFHQIGGTICSLGAALITEARKAVDIAQILPLGGHVCEW